MAHWLAQKLPQEIVHQIFMINNITPNGVEILKTMAEIPTGGRCYQVKQPYGISVIVTHVDNTVVTVTDGVESINIYHNMRTNSDQQYYKDDIVIIYRAYKTDCGIKNITFAIK